MGTERLAKGVGKTASYKSIHPNSLCCLLVIVFNSLSEKKKPKQSNNKTHTTLIIIIHNNTNNYSYTYTWEHPFLSLLHEAFHFDVSFSFMNCSWVSYYRPIKVPFRTSHLAEGQAGLRPWVEISGRQRCRWCRHAGLEWAGQSPHGPPRPPARRQHRHWCRAGHGSGFCVRMTHRKRRQAAPPAPAREGSGAARRPKPTLTGERDNNSSPSEPSPPMEPGWGKDSEGIMARYLRWGAHQKHLWTISQMKQSHAREEAGGLR